MAWEFWANHAPADQISYEYKYLKECVAHYGSDEDEYEDEDGDEDEDDSV
jgi:hypothetical protein